MQGSNSAREYIATQAPRPWTVNDLWRMVWEYDCRAIIMLTNLVEAGKVRVRGLETDHYL